MKIAPSRLFALLGLALFFAAPAWSRSAPAQEAAAQQLAGRVDAYYNGLHSLSADFTETYVGIGIHRQERGTLILRKPGKMRWSYTQPPGKVFILNGKEGWFYSPGDAQAQRIAAKQMDDLRSPLRFLLGHTHLEKEIDGLTLSNSGAGLKLWGVPRGMESRVSRMTLSVTSDGVIQSMTIRETDGASTVFTFTNNQPNAPAPNADFVFHPPAGVPIVNGFPPV